MSDKTKFKVCIRCYTFNHSKYIEEAMSGFTMQKTSFPFVCCIVDDASTDGEQEIIKKYFSDNFEIADDLVARHEETEDFALHFAKHKFNNNCFFAVLLLKYNHFRLRKSKLAYMTEWNECVDYTAICEGDDYWTATDKLEKQVKILDAHPEYSFCVHNFVRYLQKENRFTEGYRYNDNFVINTKKYLKLWPTQPLTAVMRKNAEPSAEERKKYKFFRDNHLFYLLLKKGNGFYIAEKMGVYRVSGEGIWTSLDKIGKEKIDLDCFVELYEHNQNDTNLWKLCLEKYSSYLFICHINGVEPQRIKRKSIGLLGIILSYIRYEFVRIHAFFRPELKKRSIMNITQ